MDRSAPRRKVVATVSVVVEEFEMVRLEIGNGDTLAIGKRTKGVEWRALKVGQRVLCEVSGTVASRVEQAWVLD